MKKMGFEMIPYGAGENGLPDSGIVSFLEIPRFATGYAAQHNIISYITETHMLKPFDKRVYATYNFMQCLIDLIKRDAKIIGNLKMEADEQVSRQQKFALNWEEDTVHVDTITFKGYTAGYKASEVSGLTRLYYDREKAYIIPQAWGKVIDLFRLNGVKMQRLNADTTIKLEMYYINDYKTVPKPYEGHYIHSKVNLTPVETKIRFYKGDYVVIANQALNRYIVETLEPKGVDSFFAWNFFDSVLGEKEYFSDYVFEDVAAELLKNDPNLKAKLDEEKQKNPQLAGSARLQLNFVYRNSPYFEKTYLRYPVGRVLSPLKLNTK